MGQQIHIAAHSPLLAGWLAGGRWGLRSTWGGWWRSPRPSLFLVNFVVLLFEKEHRKIGFNTQNKSGDYD